MSALTLAVVMALTGGAALAQNRDQAKEAYRLGVQHYDLGEYAAALDSFKEAYRHYESPELLYNIAQCHRLLGHKEQALRTYRMYLNAVPSSPDGDTIRSLMARLEAELAADQQARTNPGAAASPLSDTRAAPPLHKRWWLWTTVAGVVVIGAGVATGLSVWQSQSLSAPKVATDLGTFQF